MSGGQTEKQVQLIQDFDPDIITFYGQDQMGMRTQLVQHVSQLNVMLRALPKKAPAEAPTHIGFRLAQDLEQG